MKFAKNDGKFFMVMKMEVMKAKESKVKTLYVCIQNQKFMKMWVFLT